MTTQTYDDSIQTSGTEDALRLEMEGQRLRADAAEAELDRVRRNYSEAEEQLVDTQGRLVVALLALRRIAAGNHLGACGGPDCNDPCFSSQAQWVLGLLDAHA